MNVGILGSGVVGQALGDGFLKNGWEVMIGTRSPGKLSDWTKKHGPKARVGSFSEAAAFGRLLVLAAKGAAAKQTLSMAGEANLNGKAIIDATNPIDDHEPPKNGVLKFFTSLDRSLMEDLQAAYPKARFVKAFNSIGSAFMVNPNFGQKPTMFICGDDSAAKKEVAGIVDQFGFEVEDVGVAAAARALEPLCILWCLPGFLRNDWAHAFKLLKK